MIVVDPPGTLLRVAVFALMGGLGSALAGCALIYLCARVLPPRQAPGSLWREWRRKRPVWAIALLLAALGAELAAEMVFRSVALRDLYWIGRKADIQTIARLGAACGYFLGLLMPVTGALLGRRGPARTRR